MTIPEVPVPPVKERRPREEEILPYVYHLAFRAYNYDGEFQGLVLTGGLTWEGPYTFFPMEGSDAWPGSGNYAEYLENESIIDSFYWGQWSRHFDDRPYEKDPRPPLLIKESFADGDPEYTVIYPLHDGIADEPDDENSVTFGPTCTWTGAAWNRGCPIQPIYSDSCDMEDGGHHWVNLQRPARTDYKYNATWDIWIPCCSRNMTNPYPESATKAGPFEVSWFWHIWWSCGFFDWAADKPAFGAMAAPPYSFEDHWSQHAGQFFLVVGPTEVIARKNYNWPYFMSHYSTYMKDGRGGGVWMDQQEWGIKSWLCPVREHATHGPPPAGHTTNWEVCAVAGWWGPRTYDTSQYYNYSWSQYFVVNGTIYEIAGNSSAETEGSNFFWNEPLDENPDMWQAFPRYFEIQGQALLAFSAERFVVDRFDYWLFSPELNIEEHSLQFEQTHWNALYEFHLLPIKDQNDENLYGNGHYELIRITTPIKIQTG